MQSRSRRSRSVHSAWLSVATKLDARTLRARLPDLRAGDPRQAARVPRLGRELAEAAAGARRDDGVLRDLVRERPSRRLRARRARDRGARARAGAGARVRQRARRPRDHLRPQRDRGDQPRRVRLGPRRTSAPATSSLVTELEHHSNFVPWQFIAGKTGAELRMIPLDDQGELDLSTLDEVAQGGNVKVVATNLDLELARHDQPGREARRVGARAAARSTSATPRRPRRTRRSTCRRSASTSSRSRATRCAGRAARARSGDAPSCCWRWIRS